MYSVELMVAEHENILKLLSVIRKACMNILEGQEVDDGDFRKFIEFSRNYADKHHHGKEEKIFFKAMTENLGQVAEKLIHNGMLVEHDLGRLHIAELERALDSYKEEPKAEHRLSIIAEAVGYTNLLKRHIEKENQVVFTFAEKNLAAGVIGETDEKIKEFEREAESNNVQGFYLESLAKFSKKYGID